MNGFRKALAEYEEKYIYNPLDYLPLTDEEIQELEDKKEDYANELVKRAKENDTNAYR